jgi:hypothetical protein
MKKQLLLTIIFISALNGGDMAQFKDMSSCKYKYNEMPEYLAKSINRSCKNYIDRTASMGALYGAAAGVGVSAAWFYYNPDTRTVTNIFTAMYGTLLVGALSYLVRDKQAQSHVRSYEGTLKCLVDQHHNLLVASLLSVGGKDLYIPTVNAFQAKKQRLENLFQEPQYRGPNESDRYREILNEYPDRRNLNDPLPVYFLDDEFAAIDRIEKLIAHNTEANTRRLTISDVILKTKDTFLIQIISDATVKKNIELNLALHKSLYNLHEQMRAWLDFVKDTDEYKKAVTQHRKELEGTKKLPDGNTIADSINRLSIWIKEPAFELVKISERLYAVRAQHPH